MVGSSWLPLGVCLCSFLCLHLCSCGRHCWVLGTVIVGIVGVVGVVVAMGIVVVGGVVVIVVIVVMGISVSRCITVVVVVNGHGRSSGDSCDMSHMINKHMLNKQTTTFCCIVFLQIPQNIPVSILECSNSAGMIRHCSDENSRPSCQISFHQIPLDSTGMTRFLWELGGHCEDLTWNTKDKNG